MNFVRLFLLDEIEKPKFWYNVLPISKFVYVLPSGKKETIEITKELCEKIVDNFKQGIPHYQPPVNISHNDFAGSYGTVIDMEAKDDGLWILVELTEEGYELVKNGKFRYMSAEFTERYVEKKTGQEVGPVFLGVALTNRPAHPEVAEIKLEEEAQEIIKLGITPMPPESWEKDETSKWSWDWAKDADAIINKFGWKTLALACTYVDTDNYEKGESGYPEVKAAYVLPFAKVKNGKMTIYWNGVRTAMAYLLGARGGVKAIPKDKKKEAYNKLAKLYKLFDKEPPEFHLSEEVSGMDTKMLEVQITKLTEQLKTFEEEKAKLLEEKNKLEEQVKELSEKLAQAEREKLETQVKAWKEDWVRKGVKPTVVEKAATIVLEDPEKIKQFDEMFKDLANPDLFKQFSEENDNPNQDPVTRAKKVSEIVFKGGDER